jgi:8-oxo-dGTP diphosphatase
MPLVIQVTAAVVQDDAGRYLITQRRRGSHLEGLWEFPGGKLEAGESPEAGLQRELREELGADFVVDRLLESVRWEYPDRTVVLHFYGCRVASGRIEAREAQEMRWVAADELSAYEFPPADRALIDRLRRR